MAEDKLIKIAILAQQGLGDVIMQFPLFAGILKKYSNSAKIYVIVGGKIAQSILDSRFPKNNFCYIHMNGSRLERQMKFIKCAWLLRKEKLDYLLTYGFFSKGIVKKFWVMLVSAKTTITTLDISGME